MSEINDIDFEQDQQEVLEKTDIKTLSHYCLMLQNYEDQLINMEKDMKKIKEQADKITEIMEQGLELNVPSKVDQELGNDWGEVG